MKNFDLSHFLGCCVIGIGIVIAGWLISEELPETPDTTYVPSSYPVITQTQDEHYGNYLSKWQVADYLNIGALDVDALLSSGELDGTYTVIGEDYVFSKAKIDEWIEKRIG